MNPTWKRGLTRLLSLALTAALTAQPALAAGQASRQPTVPEGWSNPFTDLKQEWYYPYVAVLNSQHIIDGYGDGRFGPKDPVSAGAALVMVLKAAGLGTMAPEQGAHWASSYAEFAVARGWLTQTETNQLDGAIPRLLIAQLTAKALGLSPQEGDSPFADAEDGYLTALYRQGIVSGTQDGAVRRFYPSASITRAEISAIVWQVQQYASSIHFGGQTVPVLAALPANSYDLSAFHSDGGRMSYNKAGGSVLTGIDVSHNQGSIDWNRVKDDGIDFAMLRVGGRGYGVDTGVIFEDRQFRANLQGASAAGLDLGVYFFSQAITVEEAEEEARFVLEQLQGYDLSCPVVFDWETISYDAARTDQVDKATLTAMADAFCRTVEQAGYQPMLYFTPYLGYLRYDLSAVSQYPFWLAHHNSYPGSRYDFQMWQYSETGHVDGIQGNVDLNLWFLP